MSTPDNWLYHYQTLLTGALAVIAAFGAIAATRKQISQAERHHERDRDAKLRAARAAFPMTLATICNYAKQMGQAIQAVWPAAANLFPNDDAGGTYSVTADLPKFPDEVLDSLERNIEFSANPEVIERIASIMREIQILSSRTDLLDGPDGVNTDFLAGLIVQSASVYARAESLFTYARGKSETVLIMPLWDRAFAALHNMAIRNPKVLEFAQAQRNRDEGPGEADSEEPI